MPPRVLIVSNRLPVTLRRRDGGFEVERSSGGLATGLRGPHERGDGWWLGWPGLADELTEAERAELTDRLTRDRLAPLFLSATELARYYDGFANGFIWPVFHYLTGQVPHRTEDWPVYREVNERFADAVAARYQEGDLIWVHDYQLMLVPALLRQRLPHARIGFFLHIPFPASEVYRMLPHREELLRGLLGADLIGFHTTSYLRHFAAALLLLLGLPTQVDRVMVEDRVVRLGVFPMGVDAKRISALAERPSLRAEVEEVRRGSDYTLVAIDRLDYTKGVPQRLLAFETLLQQHPELRGRVKLVNLAVPSRVAVRAYRQFRREVNALVGRINGAFATPSWVPVHYMFRGLPERRVLALYRAADVMLVTPIRDGMNLVAKEYVAARTDLRGVLVLSEYAGAAAELVEAITTNPFEIERTAEAYYTALMLPEQEQRERMRSLRNRVMTHDVQRWVESFLKALAEQTPRLHTVVSGNGSARAEAVLPTLLAARRLVLVLDYDGTLVPLAPSPEQAIPDEGLLDLLRRLATRRRTEVHILSGRTTGFLERWFGELPVNLHAEHGSFTRRAGRNRWQRREHPAPDWQEAVRPILADFARRTPGALVEVKEAGLAWHWRAADPEVGDRQANELGLHLGQLLSNLPLELLWGDRVLEVRPHGVHKGLVAAELAAEHLPEGVLVAAGNDRTDEDLFTALPPEAITIAVGDRPSRAHYRVHDVWILRDLLKRCLSEN
ncbi:MAG TPA: bifunctional alpha,alpha-trehalose-phosphate synthase (UDP-forming)/trehalose-phosphatase [Gemmatimonadales bacterium]|jgi:trehalose 6-phosphate synthase/phosphatase|nr:bifunctional alpha,alpha-trehalose-phosphate synthase (UDP-forming)/trehalose-phosphatase [Gemmatimonadales bacterium]